MSIDLILGAAGHIDHGKTALVKALTGVDTDRLPEERKRGITIELGFAQLTLGQYNLGVVDVPGHERFVRNMLAGATGVDLALLVVAADDSVKPQTREHLEILRLLDIEAGVVALTKCDLPDQGWIDLVEDEVRGLLAGTFLEDAPLVRTSVVTGEGLPALREALLAAATRAAASSRQQRIAAPFRMAIDRVFTVAGHGAVVTGSVGSGSARVGDELRLEPGNVSVRVRGLQNHDQSVDEIHRGQRAAINLAGVRHDEIVRGQELAAPGRLAPSRRISARVRILPTASRPLGNRDVVRCHLGAMELTAYVTTLEGASVAQGDTGLVQLAFQQHAVCDWGQPLVLRSQSPVATIGGGHVLDPSAERLRRTDGTALAHLRELESEVPLRRAAAAVFFAGFGDWSASELQRRAGVSDGATATSELLAAGTLIELTLSHGRSRIVHAAVLYALFDAVEKALAVQHDIEPLRTSLDRSRLLKRFEYVAAEPTLDAALDAMQRAGRLVQSAHGVALRSRGPQLSSGEKKLLDWILERCRAGGLAPPTASELRAEAPRCAESTPQLLRLAAAAGDLVEVSPELFLHAHVETELRRRLAVELAGQRGLTVSQIREILGVSRKFAVPICEYLDRVGFTRRVGDLRTLAGAAASSAVE